jgi:hypothetical protein
VLAWHDCLRTAARQYDDGYSDASSIAAGIAPLCRAQFNAAVETFTRGANAPKTRMVQERMAAREIANATPAVLQVRAERKAPRT